MKKCVICQKKAIYDAKTIIAGQWAYLCQNCFDDYGIKLGLGYGQFLKEDKEYGEDGGDEEDEEM